MKFCLLIFSPLLFSAVALAAPEMVPLYGVSGTFHLGKDGKAYFDPRIWKEEKKTPENVIYKGFDPDGAPRYVEVRRNENGKPYAVIGGDGQKETAMAAAANWINSTTGYELLSWPSHGGFDGTAVTSLDDQMNPKSNTFCLGAECLTVTPALCQAVLDSTGVTSFEEFTAKRAECGVIASRWNTNIHKPLVEKEQKRAFEEDVKVVSGNKGASSYKAGLRQMSLEMDEGRGSARMESFLVNNCGYLFGKRIAKKQKAVTATNSEAARDPKNSSSAE